MPTLSDEPMLPKEVAKRLVITPDSPQEASPTVQGLMTPGPDEVVSSVPPSGFRVAFRETGRAVGWLTKPIWKPPTWIVINLLAKDAQKIIRAPLISRDHLRAWIDRGRNDLRDWDSWTPEERTSVRRQETMWVACWVVSAFLALTAGSIGAGRLGLFPIGLVAGAWALRSHNTRLPIHFDAVRWLLNLPQVKCEGKELQR